MKRIQRNTTWIYNRLGLQNQLLVAIKCLLSLHLTTTTLLVVKYQAWIATPFYIIIGYICIYNTGNVTNVYITTQFNSQKVHPCMLWMDIFLSTKCIFVYICRQLSTSTFRPADADNSLGIIPSWIDTGYFCQTPHLTTCHKILMVYTVHHRMMSWHGNVFRITGPMCDVTDGDPPTKTSNAKFWLVFFW